MANESSEKYIEKRLVYLVKSRGGICIKYPSSFFNGFPDRLILLPNGLIAFVELKSTGKKPTTLQLAIHKQLIRLGFKVFVIDNVNQIKQILDEITQIN